MPNRMAFVVRTGQKATQILAEDDGTGVVSPITRLLLSDRTPKMIQTVYSDYVQTPIDAAAMSLLQDEKKDSIKRSDVVNCKGKADQIISIKGIWLPKEVSYFSASCDGGQSPQVPINQRNDITDEVEGQQKHMGVNTVHRLYLAAAYTLLKRQNTGVAALLVDPTGKIVAYGRKNTVHPLLHAEASILIQRNTKMPKEACIYSTLQPCKFCRAVIAGFADGDYTVYYGQQDNTGKAMMGADSKYILMTGDYQTKNYSAKPIWLSKERGGTTTAAKLNEDYTTLKDKMRGEQGIIDFISSNKKAEAVISKATDFLTIKMKDYKSQQRKKTYNENVKKCLEHIADFLARYN